jgi:hypothetical protein
LVAIDNEIKNFAGFARIRMPADWVERPSPKDRGASWLRCFTPSDSESAEIGIFHDGSILSDTICDAFRSALQSGFRTIFDTDRVFNNEQPLAALLSTGLGNAGQNQLTVAGTEWELFTLERMSVTEVVGHAALQVTGYFRDENGVPVNYYETLCFDGTASEDHCRIFQVYLQAATSELFQLFKPEFDKTLGSIEFE